MELCDDGCCAVCDFCGHYDFNEGLWGEYHDNGFCRLLKERRDPNDTCEDFRCFKLGKGEVK